MKWMGGFLAITALLTTVFGGWWYFQDEKLRNEQWFMDDQHWNSTIIEQLVDIRSELAVLKQDLTVTIDRHEEFVSGEHRDSQSSLVEAQAVLGQTITGAIFHLGVHQGQHLESDDPAP